MGNRACPFCLTVPSIALGTRVDAWHKCRNCRSVFRDITPAKFGKIHAEAFQDGEFIAAVVAAGGREPACARWDLLCLPGASVLEIGPGSGHLLAGARQAGRSVAAVETSQVHRDFIREAWGITEVYPDMTGIPAGRSFDAIVTINTFEHVYDVKGFLSAVRRVLAPGGTLLVSTVNGASLEAAVLRNWWSMCKVHDHFSFPSPAGMALAARAAGFRVERIWSAELPFEFPVSVLASARDRLRDRQGPRSAAGGGHAPAPRPGGAVNAAAKARLARFYAAAAPFDPASRLLGALGRAATVKARLSA
jgi:2-polyprenyl-3-methyl-5-hydroxy-6-metoxy-1,4-benzoquinol methylase